MRYHEPFTLIKRKLKSSNKGVWYYRFYDSDGVRKTRSTGETSRTAAYTVVMNLYSTGKLGETNNRIAILLSDYANHFFDWENSVFLKEERERGRHYSRVSCEKRQLQVDHDILPYFKNTRIDLITTAMIEKWMQRLKDERGLMNTTINAKYSLLSVIMKEAARKGIIKYNPCLNVKILASDERERGMLTLDEARKLLNTDSLWDNKLYHIGNRLAAVSGMRLREIVALRGMDIKADHIVVEHSYDKYGLKKTKTKDKRKIAIVPSLMNELHALKFEDDTKFIFSKTGKKPISANMLMVALYEAMSRMGISQEERKERNITFHSWRHFAASQMAANNISNEKRMKLTGHKTASMLEHYTHFDAESMRDVADVLGEVIE